MICSDVIKLLENQAPIDAALDFDNPGLIVGRRDKTIKKVLIGVDATEDLIDTAVEHSVDMLLTHHPMIFSAIKKVNCDDYTGRRIFKLIQNDICYYAMHTNFDIYGMGAYAAQILGISDTEVLEVCEDNAGVLEGIGRVGYLESKMTLSQCCELVKEKFSLEWVKVFGELDKNVHKVAISPGSGKSMVEFALRHGVDVLITGDIDHHVGIDANGVGLQIIDAGHYGIEKIFVPFMEEYLKANSELEIICEEEQKPFVIV